MSPKTDLHAGTALSAQQTPPAKPLRRDAELNLARILIAARDIFAEFGYEASMEQIAARAEVGIGTLYRRFPTKADLCAAVVDAATERTCQIARQVLLEASAGDAVFEFIRRCVETPSSWRAATSRRPWSGSGADQALAALIPLIDRIVTASQQAGTARTDIDATDVVTTLMAVRALGDLCDTDAPSASRRFLDIALDGLRAGHNPLAHPAISIKQLGQVLTDR